MISAAQSPPSKASVVGALVGNAIEWYDFLAYSIFSLYFAKAFFPADMPTVQLMNTAAIAAVGYVARPVGSCLIGLYADRRGRRRALTLSVAGMCIGSIMIAFAPTYAIAGAWAPALLIGARLLQGLCMGGEYATSAVYLSEIVPANRRGFYMGFVQVSVVSGQLFALALMLFMQYVWLSTSQIESWGWRVPFLIGGALALFAVYIRRHVVEPLPEASKAHSSSTWREMYRHWRLLLLAVGISVGGTLAFYTYTIYIQKFLINTLGIEQRSATLICAGALLLYMPLQPLFGWLSDRVGRRPVLLGFAAGSSALSVPIFSALQQAHSLAWIFVLVLCGLVLLSGFTSIHMLVSASYCLLLRVNSSVNS